MLQFKHQRSWLYLYFHLDQYFINNLTQTSILDKLWVCCLFYCNLLCCWRKLDLLFVWPTSLYTWLAWKLDFVLGSSTLFIMSCFLSVCIVMIILSFVSVSLILPNGTNVIYLLMMLPNTLPKKPFAFNLLLGLCCSLCLYMLGFQRNKKFRY